MSDFRQKTAVSDGWIRAMIQRASASLPRMEKFDGNILNLYDRRGWGDEFVNKLDVARDALLKRRNEVQAVISDALQDKGHIGTGFPRSPDLLDRFHNRFNYHTHDNNVFNDIKQVTGLDPNQPFSGTKVPIPGWKNKNAAVRNFSIREKLRDDSFTREVMKRGAEMSDVRPKTAVSPTAASAAQQAVKAASPADIWHDLSPLVRRMVIGGGIGSAVGAGAGYGVSKLRGDDASVRDSLIGAGAGGLAGIGGGALFNHMRPIHADPFPRRFQRYVPGGPAEDWVDLSPPPLTHHDSSLSPGANEMRRLLRTAYPWVTPWNYKGAAALDVDPLHLGAIKGAAWAEHAALNAGQAARDVRYFFNHPDADKVSEKGTAKHMLASAVARTPSLAGNLYYAALPPQLHHTPEELADIDKHTAKEWFLKGYKPWEYDKEDWEARHAKTAAPRNFSIREKLRDDSFTREVMKPRLIDTEDLWGKRSKALEKQAVSNKWIRAMIDRAEAGLPRLMQFAERNIDRSNDLLNQGDILHRAHVAAGNPLKSQLPAVRLLDTQGLKRYSAGGAASNRAMHVRDTLAPNMVLDADAIVNAVRESHGIDLSKRIVPANKPPIPGWLEKQAVSEEWIRDKILSASPTASPERLESAVARLDRREGRAARRAVGFGHEKGVVAKIPLDKDSPLLRMQALDRYNSAHDNTLMALGIAAEKRKGLYGPHKPEVWRTTNPNPYMIDPVNPVFQAHTGTPFDTLEHVRAGIAKDFGGHNIPEPLPPKSNAGRNVLLGLGGLAALGLGYAGYRHFYPEEAEMYAGNKKDGVVKDLWGKRSKALEKQAVSEQWIRDRILNAAPIVDENRLNDFSQRMLGRAVLDYRRGSGVSTPYTAGGDIVDAPTVIDSPHIREQALRRSVLEDDAGYLAGGIAGRKRQGLYGPYISGARREVPSVVNAPQTSEGPFRGLWSDSNIEQVLEDVENTWNKAPKKSNLGRNLAIGAAGLGALGLGYAGYRHFYPEEAEKVSGFPGKVLEHLKDMTPIEKSIAGTIAATVAGGMYAGNKKDGVVKQAFTDGAISARHHYLAG